MEQNNKPALSKFATVQEYKDAVKAFDAKFAPAVDAAKLDDLGKLKALAEAAKYWKWQTVQGDQFGHFEHDSFYEIGTVDVDQWAVGGESYNRVVLDFIAACDPAAILRIAALVAQQAARIAELEQQLEAGGRDRALGAAIQRAAGELPEGWDIRIDVENGAGTATLYDPAGESQPLDGGDGLAGDIEHGIELAQEGK